MMMMATRSGTNNSETIFGTGFNDIIYALGGHDQVVAGAGNDLVYAGTGNDTVWGQAGNDTVYGEAGNDQLIGGDGADYLDGGNDNDTLWGEAGDDILVQNFGGGYLYGGTGNDQLYAGTTTSYLYGEDGNDLLISGDASDYLDGGSGADTLVALRANAGFLNVSDRLVGGTGNDRFVVGDGANSRAGNVFIDLKSGDGQDILSNTRSGALGAVLANYGRVDIASPMGSGSNRFAFAFRTVSSSQFEVQIGYGSNDKLTYQEFRGQNTEKGIDLVQLRTSSNTGAFFSGQAITRIYEQFVQFAATRPTVNIADLNTVRNNTQLMQIITNNQSNGIV
jgi:Ca2+-binding RTX toxin-like protein